MTRTLNVKDVEKAIVEFGLREFVETLAESAWSGKNTEDFRVALNGVGVAILVAGKFGEEGGGENIWFVFSINDELFQINGYYASYDGSNWDDSNVEAVKPKEITQIIYVADKD